MVERLEDAWNTTCTSILQPSLSSSKLVCRLECEAGVGELFSGKRLEDGIG